ncbi:hypothetical protein HPP92_023182, partial [Vanilla planifolia]
AARLRRRKFSERGAVFLSLYESPSSFFRKTLIAAGPNLDAFPSVNLSRLSDFWFNATDGNATTFPGRGGGVEAHASEYLLSKDNNLETTVHDFVIQGFDVPRLDQWTRLRPLEMVPCNGTGPPDCYQIRRAVNYIRFSKASASKGDQMAVSWIIQVASQRASVFASDLAILSVSSSFPEFCVIRPEVETTRM